MSSDHPRRDEEDFSAIHRVEVKPRVYDSGPLVHDRGHVVLRTELKNGVAVRVGDFIDVGLRRASQPEILNRIGREYVSPHTRPHSIVIAQARTSPDKRRRDP